MSRKKLTVYDYLKCKGKRQLSVLFVHNVEEARAAEEAGIDMICTSHDAPQYGIYNSFNELKRISAIFSPDSSPTITYIFFSDLKYMIE